MESPAKSLIIPSWRYAVSGRWELRGAYPMRVVSEGGIDILEIAIPKSWGSTGQRVKASATVKLPEDRKLVTVTWNGDKMWFLTREMRKGELDEMYEFHDANGNGKVTIKETLPPRPW